MPEKPECPFCDRWLEMATYQEHKFFYAIKDEYPCVEGHTLVIPKRHVHSVFHLPIYEFGALWVFLDTVREELVIEYGVADFNIGINDGPLAGQTIAHAHIHLFPRREGDMADPRFGVRMMFGEKGPYERGRKG